MTPDERRACGRDSARARRAADPERSRAINRKSYYAHHDENVKKHREYNQRWRAKNRGGLLESLRHSNRKWKYGLSKSESQKLMNRQGWRCANRGCRAAIWNGGTVDHDHACCAAQKTCGKCVRGLLCGHCNSALGLLRDSYTAIQGLQTYLVAYRTDGGVA